MKRRGELEQRIGPSGVNVCVCAWTCVNRGQFRGQTALVKDTYAWVDECGCNHKHNWTIRGNNESISTS